MDPNPLWLNVNKRWIHSKYLEEVKYISTLWQNNNHSFTNTKCPFVSMFWAQKACFEKVSPLCAFGSAQNATFWKKLRLISVKKHAYHWKELRAPFWKKPRMRLNLSVGLTGQLPNYPLTPFLIPPISLLCPLPSQ